MRANQLKTRIFVPLVAVGLMLLSGCASMDNGRRATPSAPPPEKTATEKAQKTLSLVYLEKAAEQLNAISDPGMKRETSLSIAYIYAQLGEQQTGRRFLPPAPRLSRDGGDINRYIEYLTVLAAFADYDQIEEGIKRLDNRQTTALIRGIVVFHDAILQSGHLSRSLKEASKRIDEDSDPYAIFYLALGHQLSGDSDKARRICQKAKTARARFVACADMAATMGQLHEKKETRYYLDQAESALSSMDDPGKISPYPLMLYGRALAYAGELEKATEIYAQLEGQTDAIHLGSVLARELHANGRRDIEKSVVRNVQSNFTKYVRKADRVEYVYNCYGDFLATMELFYDLNAQLKNTQEPLLKAQLLLGAAQSLTDGFVYGGGLN